MIGRALFAGCALIAATSIALSQSQPLSQLSSGRAISGTDLFYDVQTVGVGGVKVTGAQISAFVLATPTITGVATFPDSATWGSTGVNKFTAQTVTIVGLTSASSQCLHALSTGIVAGTGSDCTAGGGTPGGSNTQVQFNNSGAFGGDSGFTVLTPGQVTVALGTITGNAKALNVTGTWNAGGVTFDAPFFMNITNSASNSASLLMDLQTGSTTTFAIQPGGNPLILAANPNGNSIVKIQSLSGSFPGFQMYDGVPGNSWAIGHQFGASVNAKLVMSYGAIGSEVIQAFIGPTGAIVGQNQIWTYNTVDAIATPVNYERGIVDWLSTTNQLTIGSQAHGTGVGRTVAFVASNTIAMSISPTINLYGQTNPGANETYAVCAGSGATSLTSGGQLFVDTTTCLASSMLTKHDIAAFNDYGMTRLASLAAPLNAEKRLATAPIEIDPIAEAMALIPVVATYDTIDNNPQFTLLAQNACQVDERLCERTKDGSVRSFRPNSVISILIAAFQKQQKEIDELKSQVGSRH